MGLFRISPHLLNVINTFKKSKNRTLPTEHKGLLRQSIDISGKFPFPNSMLGFSKHSFSDFGIVNHTPLCVAAKSGREVLRKMLSIKDDSDEHMVNTSLPSPMD